MKTATWKDGTQTVRQTHTRDYKFAWSYINSEGKRVSGFSTTYKSAQSAVQKETKFSHSKPRGAMTISALKYWNEYEKSEQRADALKREVEARKTIEIVEVV